LLLLLVGELFGLHTLRQILDAHGILSNNWAKVLASISYACIEQSIGRMLLGLVERQVAELASKSDSTWSRAEVTVVFDDSIFKQWLKGEPIGEHFAKFYSGQVNGTVYGLRITLCGLCIGDTFYPTHVHLSHKSEDTKEVGRQLLSKLHGLLHQWGLSYGLDYPNRGTVGPVRSAFKVAAHHPDLRAQEKPQVPKRQLFRQFPVAHRTGVPSKRGCVP
jgi:hypothetical protein